MAEKTCCLCMVTGNISDGEVQRLSSGSVKAIWRVFLKTPETFQGLFWLP